MGASDAPQTLDERFVFQTGIPVRWVGRPTWWCGKGRGLYHGCPACRPSDRLFQGLAPSRGDERRRRR
ncbi:hypothetical protein AvCA_27100 [Azotobacter vinelandii CA]|uniref:Uncharacterized protein n=2 Tax=Azotobacter vinelandii TaxID=354 RepID=C1DJW5_AZOVD|nr:hypothetical protein Avin_27100 [Azotobacter vinelandii DJ]AGK16566.1 hypothetical protein AvCA_27100 [Azotobacter vinelandii CA]AGK20831.1 hypothetical protein AvCA6_27100 [Azotobacter vinelandii CA6]